MTDPQTPATEAERVARIRASQSEWIPSEPDPQTPATEAGRRLLDDPHPLNHEDTDDPLYCIEAVDLRAAILAIEAEARASLDVDALARALWKTRPMFYPAAWPNDDPDDIGPSPEEDAAHIAREYRAILAEQKP